MTSLSETPVAKKRGRPLGSTNKRKRGRPAKKLAASKLFKQSVPAAKPVEKKEREQQLLKEHVERWLERSELKKKIANLEHQAIGYRAVISYLEYQLATIGNLK